MYRFFELFFAFVSAQIFLYVLQVVVREYVLPAYIDLKTRFPQINYVITGLLIAIILNIVFILYLTKT